jgi:hypothetical protein
MMITSIIGALGQQNFSGLAPVVAFRAVKTTGTNTASGVDNPAMIDFNSIEIDTHSAFASSIFVVPAAANGRTMQFVSGQYYSANAQVETAVQVSTNSGSSWSYVARYRDQNIRYISAPSPLIQVTEGDWYRAVVVYDFNSTYTVLPDALGGKNTFFSGSTVS